jgi:cell division protein FtsB
MKTIKLILSYTIIAILIVSAVINTGKQLESLKKAREENSILEVQINELREGNKNLENQILYATSSAYLEQQAREMFGLGKANDYWLKLPPENKNLDLYPEVTKGKNLPIIQQWILLFTR